MRNVPNVRAVAFAVLVACHLSLVAVLQAAVPWVLNYQGRLTDSGGKAVTGTYTMKFRLYDASTSGTKLWEESQSVTLAESDNGVFNVILGTTTVLTSVDFNSPMWLSVQVADDSEMTPRQRLTSSAYTMNADQIDGLDSAKFLRTDIDTSTSGKLTITRAGAALVITPSSAPDANTKMLDVQNTSGTSKFSVDYEGDVTVAGDLTVTGTMSGTTSTSGTTNTTWTVDNDNTSGSEPASGAGVVIEGGSGDASILWDATNDELDINQSINVTSAATVGTDLTVTSGMRVGTGSTPDNLTALADDSLFVEGDVEVDGTIYAAAVNVGGSSVGDISAVGDCATGACFTGTSGTTLTLKGSTSGTIALTPAAVAGTTTVTFPATTGTVVTTGDSGTVTTTMILDSTISTDDVAADTLTSGDLATGSVETTEIAADTITAGDIATGAVATAEILDGTIITDDVAADTLTAGDLAADSVGTSEIASGAVATDEIAADTITSGDVAASAITASELADDAVDEGALKMVNSATDEYILTYESTTGDFEWEAASDLGVSINYNDIGDPTAAGSISFDSGETGTYAFTISANTNQSGSYNLDLTNGITTLGNTISQSALDIDLTNADHTGGTTTLYGIDLALTDNDNASTSNVYALNIGDGFDRALNVADSSVFTLGAAEQVVIDAATTDMTGTSGALDIDIDSATHTGMGLAVNVENVSTATSGTTTVFGVGVQPVQSGSGVGGTHNVIGLVIDAATTTGALDGTQSQYGVYIANQGAASTESAFGLAVLAQSGSTNNYAAVFDGTVGIGDLSPASALTVGDGEKFQVDSSGNVTLADGTLLDLDAINVSGTSEGLLLPQTTSCASGTAEGQLCWDTDNDTLYVGSGSAATAISSGGSFGATVDDTEMTAEDFGSFTCSGLEDGCTLDASSVATAEISADTITSGDIATGAVETTEIATDTITAGDLNATLTFADGDLLDLSSINVSGTAEGLTLPQATSCASGTAEGQLCWDTDDDALYIGKNGSTAIVGGSLGSTVDDTEMTAEDFGSFTCTGNEDGCTVDSGAISTTEIAADTITSDDIATGAVGTAEIAADTITSGDIATGAVETAEIAADTITGDDVADHLTVDGTEFRVGDGGSNYAQFGTDGAVTYAGTAQPKRTIVLTAAGAIVAPSSGFADQRRSDGTNLSYYTLDFDQSTDEKAYWTFMVPDSFTASTITVTVFWTAASGTATHLVDWEVSTSGTADDGVLDASLGTATTINDALIATGDVHVTSAGSITSANNGWAAGEFVVFKLNRDADDATNDTLAADAKVLQVKLEWTASAETD